MIIRQTFIFRSDLRANPACTYVFGDNLRRAGLGGQAKEMRGEPNAFGIATLVATGNPFRDDDEARLYIEDDLQNLLKHMRELTIDQTPRHPVLVWPSAGVGSGLANMPPGLRSWMDQRIYDIFGIINELP